MEYEIHEGPRSRLPIDELPSTHVDSPTEAARPPLADHVKHRDGAAEIGKLSAEAIHENEVTAIDPESTGAERFEHVARCETIRHEALAVTEALREIAVRCREKAELALDHLEDCSLVVAEARRTCSELRDTIAFSHSTDNFNQTEMTRKLRSERRS
jgi:hypothetical protein